MALEIKMESSVENEYSKMTRKDFPEGFVFGTATSAYQAEGAATAGGRGLSVWDDFTMRDPKRTIDGSNGNLAVDMYNRYKEDIRMMKSMGFDAYRFSISWPRIIPSGKRCHGVNREGIDHYNDVINTLLAHGIEPHVSLFHNDLPMVLEKEYHGFLSETIVDDFRDYADLCFWEFGDRVKHWITFNEPWSYCYLGYVSRQYPPGVKLVYTSDRAQTTKTSVTTRGLTSDIGDIPLPLHDDRMTGVYLPPPTVHVPVSSAMRTLGLSPGDFHADETFLRTRSQGSTSIDMSREDKEPFLAAKHLILAHLAATRLYKRKYKDHQQGQIGIALNTHWFEGLTDKKEDQDAAARVHDFRLGWFLEPVLSGCYPETMREHVPDEANFKKVDSKRLRKYRIDFLGLNYYTARYVQYDPNPQLASAFERCQLAKILTAKDGKEIGPVTPPACLHVVPWGIKKLLNRIKKLYHDRPKNALSTIYITENGLPERDDPKAPASKFIEDTARVEYYRDHLGNIVDVIKEWEDLNVPDKMEIKGYFAWSWIDNFEWDAGYTARFGLIYTDYMNDLKRYPKLSAIWFSQFLAGKIPRLLEGNAANARSNVVDNEDTDYEDDDDGEEDNNYSKDKGGDDDDDDDDEEEEEEEENKVTQNKGHADDEDDDNDDYDSDL